MNIIPVQNYHNLNELPANSHWYNALLLSERLRTLRLLEESEQFSHPYDHALAHSNLQQWREQYPFDQDCYFEQWLAMQSMTEQEFLHLLGEGNEAIQARIPTIPDWLKQLSQAFSNSSDSLKKPFPLPFKINTLFKETPFLFILSPLIIPAIERLQAGIDEIARTYQNIPFQHSTIILSLFTNLSPQLLLLINRTLTLELQVARLKGQLKGKTPEERFQNFVVQLRQKEVILPIMEEYSAMTRLAILTIENWVNCSLEFLHRLCADWEEIRCKIALGHDAGYLVQVDASAGDRHKSGRSTLKLTFSNGFQLIYKPRSLAIEVHFQNLLAWLNKRGAHPSFRILQIIDKGAYGWSEFVLPRECHSEEEVARFYERQGSYLALLYALEATDMHFENLIASGEDPVIIDLEALFQPRSMQQTPSTAQSIAREILNYSVLRVGLLPKRTLTNTQQIGIDISGLTGNGDQLTPCKLPRIEATGTDQMRFVREYIQIGKQHNQPMLAGKAVDVLKYSNQFVAGFTSMYHLLLNNREELLSGPLQQFAHDEIRVILRPTQIYAQLLYESYHPDLLRNALDRDRFFNRLWMSIEHQPYIKKVIAAELLDLHGGDIPIFTSRPNTCNIFTSHGQCISNFLEETSLDAVKKQFQRLDEQDLSRQIWFIEASLATIHIGNGHIAHKKARMHPSQHKVSSEQLLHASCSIGDRLCERALTGKHGTNWIGLTYLYDREWALLPTSIDLYNGASGIALFLAYLGMVTAEKKYTRCAQSALTSIQKQVEELQGHMQSIGAYEGWGSIIYLYSHLGLLWNEPALFSEGEKIIDTLLPLLIKDQKLDIISGTAGCLACLLKLYSIAPSARILTTAIQCGDWLISNAAQCRNSNSQNIVTGSPPLTGFSHGAAGMALSLLRLFDICNLDRFQKAAFTAMEYERGCFSPEQCNWPDFRTIEVGTAPRQSLPDATKRYMTTWCHGAPGIGLARLASLKYIDDLAIRQEITSALTTTMNQGFCLNHSLCHGNFGNLETLLMAAIILPGVEYKQSVESLATMLFDSINIDGWLTGVPHSVESPGLMTGIAGIGYELIRLAAPEKVPSVLLLE